MFTTCIHCNADLGRNEAFETFPVGSRLAFDAAKGRLWVVCRHCARWNLTPLDERWETIEAAERRFRDSRLRVSTDNVGMARLREGVDLIRIGVPQRPEMAAWRYGDQFGRRRKRQMMVTGVLLSGATALVGGIMAAGIGVGVLGGFAAQTYDLLINGRPNTLVARIRLPDGQLVDVQRKHARMSAIERHGHEESLALRLETVNGSHLLIGEAAMKAAARLLPTVNRYGGSRREVSDAVAMLERSGDPLRALQVVQRRVGGPPPAAGAATRWKRRKESWHDTDVERISKLPGSLHALEARYRLALEMALHEESERRAMDGEMALLEAAWREAEEIAHIADTMFVPDAIEGRLEALKRGDAPPAPGP